MFAMGNVMIVGRLEYVGRIGDELGRMVKSVEVVGWLVGKCVRW